MIDLGSGRERLLPAGSLHVAAGGGIVYANLGFQAIAYDLASGTELGAVGAGDADSVAVSPDGRLVVVAGYEGVRRYSLEK